MHICLMLITTAGVARGRTGRILDQGGSMEVDWTPLNNVPIKLQESLLNFSIY